MSELTVFQFQESEVRTVVIGGEPWFIGRDVCAVLGYTNVSKTLDDHVHAEDKSYNDSLLSVGQRGAWLINEAGLYSLVLRSKMEQARTFQRWVTREVLPSIRKNGGYLSPTVDFTDPENIQAILDNWKADRKKLEQAKETIVAYTPKVEFYDAITASEDTISMGEVAKVLNFKDMGRNNLFQFLRQRKVLDSSNVPYQTYVDRLWFEVTEKKYTDSVNNTHITLTTVVRQAGLDGIRKLLLKAGYVSNKKGYLMHIEGFDD